MNELDKLRKEIDGIDEHILRLVSKRLEYAANIGRIKKESGISVVDGQREKEIIDKVDKLSDELGIDPSTSRKIFFDLMQLSKSKQFFEKIEPSDGLKLSMAFQGEHGAYSEAAIKKAFPNCEAIACPTFFSVFESLEKELVEAALLPVENSTEGSVTPVYDLLMETELNAFSEIFLRIEHCLIAHPETDISQIKEIYSHPQALEQCRGLFKRINSKPVPYYDTAGAVSLIKESGRKDIAAIASKQAAKHYGMNVLEENIEDSSNNFTRFLALGKSMQVKLEEGKSYKTSFVFSVRHEPGSLFRIMKIIADKNINLTKLESRPTKKSPWEYVFFVDFEGHMEEPSVAEALKEIENHSLFVKVFGSYKRGD
jgi:chorismate mutase/prephenate dehydratase